jgi:DNA mismatch endonuclease (patch repair protein)
MRPRTMRHIRNCAKCDKAIRIVAVADRISKAQRSHIMRSVKQVGNKTTELRLIQIMRSAGIVGWRRKSSLEGKPDFVFRKAHLAVFVDGCFWHGCPRCHTLPASNQDFWRAKVVRNKTRDRLVKKRLTAGGWKVLRVWECQLRTPERIQQRLNQLM